MTTESASEAGASSRISPIGILAVLVAAACWGTSGIFVKFVVAESEVTALALAFWRDLTTFVVLVGALVILRPRWLRVRRSELRLLAAMGTTLGIFHVFWNLAVMLNGAAVATVQQAAMPAIVAVVAWFLWREPLTWVKIAAILLAFVGTVLVSAPDLLDGEQLSLAGLVIGLGTPITYAAWTLLGKKARQAHNPITTLTYAFAFGALVLLPLQFFTPQPFPVSGEAVVWFAALIGLSTIVSFSSYTWALGHLPASVASIVVMSEIAFVAFYAVVLLGERLTSSQILGAILVLGGVLLLTWAPGSRRKAIETI
jgi:drug/metabolite transporter (DMT)-like permease